VRSIHHAITARLTRSVAIKDAGWDEDHYFPRCQSGQSSCNIAAPLGEMSFRLRPTLEYLGRVNTSLDQALDELDAVSKSYVQLSRENAELRR
jgi:hypothetical protein